MGRRGWPVAVGVAKLYTNHPATFIAIEFKSPRKLHRVLST